jgi:hypothetical protein
VGRHARVDQSAAGPVGAAEGSGGAADHGYMPWAMSTNRA